MSNAGGGAGNDYTGNQGACFNELYVWSLYEAIRYNLNVLINILLLDMTAGKKKLCARALHVSKYPKLL